MVELEREVIAIVFCILSFSSIKKIRNRNNRVCFILTGLWYFYSCMNEGIGGGQGEREETGRDGYLFFYNV